MDLFLIGAADPCGGLGPIVNVLYAVLKIFWILIPIALIVFGTIDLGKAVIASDEKEVKAAQGRLIKRFIYAALVFFVPMLVSAVMGLLADGNIRNDNTTDTVSWSRCYQYIRNAS